MLKRFNVRVYGILKDSQNRVLVADEFIKGNYITKFPGGGLEIGEGLRDGLAREFLEELGVRVTVAEHLYTTDYFVASAFDSDSQVICVYYLVQLDDCSSIKSSEQKFNFEVTLGKDAESFRWVPIERLKEEEHLNLPTDRSAVVELLRLHNKF